MKVVARYRVRMVHDFSPKGVGPRAKAQKCGATLVVAPTRVLAGMVLPQKAQG